MDPVTGKCATILFVTLCTPLHSNSSAPVLGSGTCNIRNALNTRFAQIAESPPLRHPKEHPVSVSRGNRQMIIENLRRKRRSNGKDVPIQLSLRFGHPSASCDKPRVERPWRIANLDQRMTTTEVLRVVGVHRATLHRWTRRGAFPAKHHSGGWLRSDIETWLSSRASESGPSMRVNPGALESCVHT